MQFLMGSTAATVIHYDDGTPIKSLASSSRTLEEMPFQNKTVFLLGFKSKKIKSQENPTKQARHTRAILLRESGFPTPTVCAAFA